MKYIVYSYQVKTATQAVIGVVHFPEKQGRMDCILRKTV